VHKLGNQLFRYELNNSFVYFRCPIATRSATSWYWTVDETSSDDMYVVQTGLVPAFKLYSGNVVYLHCNLQLCLNGDACPLTTEVVSMPSPNIV